MELAPRKRVFEGHSRLRLHHQTVGAMVGRQSGKTLWCAARVAAQALMPSFPPLAELVDAPKIGPQHIAYTAQTRLAAMARWHEHIAIMNDSPEIKRGFRSRLNRGSERLEFANGSTYEPITPTREGARGWKFDLVIVDEALAHPMWLLGALRPTMAQRDSAIGCLGAQFVVISNAGTDDSELLNHMQELGQSSVNDPDARRCWFEWSMAPESDPFALSTWEATIPTLNQPNGIDEEFLRSESETMKADQFMREYLCYRTPATDSQIIPNELWYECVRNDVIIPVEGMVMALDVRIDRQGASLMACGRADDYLPIEIIDVRQGLEWVVPRVIEVCARWSSPLAIDENGPAANLISAFELAGVNVIRMGTKEVTAAAATFYDCTFAKRITHMNDYRLNDAIRGASRRAVGERWAFDRRGFHDISPLVAASLAVWVVETNTAAKPGIW